MKNTIDIPDSELLTWSMPDRMSVQKKHRDAFDRRVKALGAVWSGTSVAFASKQYRVDRGTLTTMIDQAPALADDGKPKGFRVCLPYFRHGSPPSPKSKEVPSKARPHALNQLLTSVSDIADLVAGYKGQLPIRNERCAAFEALFKRFKSVLRQHGLVQDYPLNTPDKGRRALLKYFKRQRAHWLADQLATAEEDERLPDFAKQLADRPMDRVEFDGHKTDVEWHALIPLATGGWMKKLISCIWMLIIVDCASRAILAWNLVVGANYNRFDVLRTFAKALTPWHPDDSLHPDLKYAPGAWMPSMVESAAQIPRVGLIAMDNHLAHISKMATQNLGSDQLGVVNLGVAGIPEGRPIVESLNKRMEDFCLRFIAGGFKPSRTLGVSAKNTTKLNPADHPIDLEMLQATLDIWVSAYNVTPQAELQQRSPRDVFDAYVAHGGWISTSSLTSSDRDDLLTIRITPTLRASKADGGLPVVNWANARYRSSKLRKRNDLIGKKFKATVNAADIREMSLWDEDGNKLVILRALPPYAASPHTLEMRRRIERGKSSGLYQIPAGADAIAIYNKFVREKAADLQWATDEFVRQGMLDKPGPNAAAPVYGGAIKVPSNTFSGFKPLNGTVTLTSPKQDRKP